MSGVALAALSGCVALVMAVAGAYLARVRMPRPPVGVYEPADIVLLCVGIVLAPLLYLELPGTAVAAVFGVVLGLAVQFTLAPVMAARWPGAGWATATTWLLAAAGCAVTALLHDRPTGVRVGTDLLIAVAVVGVANLWTQSGMRAAHVAALAAALACYDLVATALTDVTLRFATRVQGRPFAPMLALTGGRHPVSVGLGDLLLLVLFPLVAAKAYGRGAALVAGAVGVTVTGAISALFAVGALTSGFPLLTALGPLIVAQHLYWSRRLGGERTTAQWRAAPGGVRPAPGGVRSGPAVRRG
ncbi:hypothetical protein [Actinacidiphila alni]|uniref:hypothetical protein n=1 Tax=Actinacidiphila alni TaxID=380248 RepID=UPI00345578D3